MRPDICPEDKVWYYEYMLCDVKDILCIHHKADSVFEHLQYSFSLKQGYGDTHVYILGKIKKDQIT